MKFWKLHTSTLTSLGTSWIVSLLSEYMHIFMHFSAVFSEVHRNAHLFLHACLIYHRERERQREHLNWGMGVALWSRGSAALCKRKAQRPWNECVSLARLLGLMERTTESRAGVSMTTAQEAGLPVDWVPWSRVTAGEKPVSLGLKKC